MYLKWYSFGMGSSTGSCFIPSHSSPLCVACITVASFSNVGSACAPAWRTMASGLSGDSLHTRRQYAVVK